MSARTRDYRTDPALRAQPTRFGADYWPTPGSLTSALIRHVLPKLPAHLPVWECAAGDGRLARAMAEAGRVVVASDLHPSQAIECRDFLAAAPPMPDAIVLTNPPFASLDEFLERGLALLNSKATAGLVLLPRHDHFQSAERIEAFNQTSFIIACNWRPRWISGSGGNPRWAFRWIGWLADDHGPPRILHVREPKS